jgi:hypothetical protein
LKIIHIFASSLIKNLIAKLIKKLTRQKKSIKMERKIVYILINAKGERLYQYPATEYIDQIERCKIDAVNKGINCRIATKEM